MAVLEALVDGVDVVFSSAVDDAWIVDQVRLFCGPQGSALGDGPVVLLVGSLQRLRRLESTLRAGRTRVATVRSGAGAIESLRYPSSEADVVLVEQRWLPALVLGAARIWIVLDDVHFAGDSPQVLALAEARRFSPTLCLCAAHQRTVAARALCLYRPAFLPLPVEGQRSEEASGQPRTSPLAAGERWPGGASDALSPPSGSSSLPSEPGLPPSSEQAILFESMRAWRAKVARSEGVPAYRVFSNRQLQALIAVKPRTREEFLSVAGIGERAWAQYGPDFLQQLSAVS